MKYITKLPEPPGPPPKAWYARKLPEHMQATPEQKAILEVLAARMRISASPVGSLSAKWDLISEMESLLGDTETSLGESVDWYIAEGRKLVGKRS